MALWAAGAYAWDKSRKASGQPGLYNTVKGASGYGTGGQLNYAIKQYGQGVANAAKYHAGRGISGIVNKYYGNNAQSKALANALRRHLNTRINNVHNKVRTPLD